MQCPFCGENHPDASKFCPKTGQVLKFSPIQPPLPGSRPKGSIEISIVTGVFGLVMIFFGILLVTGQITLPSHRSGSKPTPTARLTEVGAVPSFRSTATRAPFPTSEPPALPPTQAAREPTASPWPSDTPWPTPTPWFTPTPTNPDLDTWIVYSYGVENESEIFRLRPSTGEVRQLTVNAYNDDAPSLLARTNELVFASYREDGWELYLLNLDTQQETRLTQFDGQARFPEWSPETGARKIVFEGRQDTAGGKRYSVWLLDVDSGELTDLTQGSADSRPQWSPDGTRVVFGRATSDTNQNGAVTTADYLGIYIYDLAGQTVTRVENSAGLDNFQYAWNPANDDWIAVCSVRRDVNGDGFFNLDDSRNLWLVRPDGGGEMELPLGDLNIFSPGFSQAGNFLVYTVHRGDSREEMWLYDMNLQSASQLVSAGPVYHPEFAVGTR